eukprot:TRINITY_DN2689_c0_g1_i1.p1 TRINITY_DN2689_c0_g1~~TRINITY_DN2689_c0_g1_i1.p1  ORF type:complete len:167 (-),score=24.41 TRINITY_DN2689_c0_g1_i1:14-514(-)
MPNCGNAVIRTFLDEPPRGGAATCEAALALLLVAAQRDTMRHLAFRALALVLLDACPQLPGTRGAEFHEVFAFFTAVADAGPPFLTELGCYLCSLQFPPVRGACSGRSHLSQRQPPPPLSGRGPASTLWNVGAHVLFSVFASSVDAKVGVVGALVDGAQCVRVCVL